MDILWHHKIIKLGITLCFLMIFYTSSASLVFADAIGASMTILSIHTKPGMLALREQYPLSQCLKESMKGGWGHKTGIKLYIYHPINLHGGDFRFVNLFIISERQLWRILT